LHFFFGLIAVNIKY